jgi:hypothetical protein
MQQDQRIMQQDQRIMQQDQRIMQVQENNQQQDKHIMQQDQRIMQLQEFKGKTQGQLSHMIDSCIPLALKNTATQVLLFMAGTQPGRSRASTRMVQLLKDDRIREVLQQYAESCLSMDAQPFAIASDELINSRNGTVHAASLEQLDFAVQREQRSIHEFRTALEQQRDVTLQHAIQLLDTYDSFKAAFVLVR